MSWITSGGSQLRLLRILFLQIWYNPTQTSGNICSTCPLSYTQYLLYARSSFKIGNLVKFCDTAKRSTRRSLGKRKVGQQLPAVLGQLLYFVLRARNANAPTATEPHWHEAGRSNLSRTRQPRHSAQSSSDSNLSFSGPHYLSNGLEETLLLQSWSRMFANACLAKRML